MATLASHSYGFEFWDGGFDAPTVVEVIALFTRCRLGRSDYIVFSNEQTIVVHLGIVVSASWPVLNDLSKTTRVALGDVRVFAGKVQEVLPRFFACISRCNAERVLS